LLTYYFLSISETCSPEIDPLHTCTVVDGRLRLFLSDREHAEDAIALSLVQVKKAIGRQSFVNRVETGLRKITFIQNIATVDVPVSAASTTREEVDGETGLSATGSSLLALGSAMIAAFVGAVYYLRQGKNREVDTTAIQESGSSFVQPSPKDDDRPTSPFSEMLPGAYRMGDLDKMSILSNSNMSPVYEDEDGSRSVVVSDSGYTTEAAGTDGGDDSSLTYTKRKLYTPEIDNGYMSSASIEYLGARPREGGEPASDLEMSDSEFDSTSEVSSQASPRKLYSTSLLLPSGLQDESMNVEDILLFENEKKEPGISIEQSMVDISLSEP
jgi:hypothetical protein